MSTPAAASGSKKITLRSSDGELFQIEESVAVELQTIKPMIEDDCADIAIPVPNVTGKILSKVIEYCNFHLDAASARVPYHEIKGYDAEFVKVDQDTVLDLIQAANYLDIRSLMDLACETLTAMMNGMTIEEIRKMFKLENDFTPEEEFDVWQANQWAFQ